MPKKLIIKRNLITDQDLSSQTLHHISSFKEAIFQYPVSNSFLKAIRKLNYFSSDKISFQMLGTTCEILSLM